MTGFAIKGWCPGALRPMMSGDGLVVRIRPVLARLDGTQARGIAAAALAHGSGLIDITARGNLQLRGVRPQAHLAMLDDLEALGLIDADAGVETRRNILVSPFWTGDDWAAFAKCVKTLLEDIEFAELPAKFGVSLDLAWPMVLQDVSSDIRVEWHRDGWLVRADGFDLGCVVRDATEVAVAVRTLLVWFMDRGVINGRGRMAALVGQALPAGFDHPMTHSPYFPSPGAHPVGHLVGLEFGQILAETLADLANFPIRITPWRMILLEGAQAAPDVPGLITQSDDPRLRISVCTGAPGCPQALQPTRTLARTLAPQVPPRKHLHISGCAKGCAHPKPADMTLRATTTGFDLILNGRASDAGAAHDTLTPLFKAM